MVLNKRWKWEQIFELFQEWISKQPENSNNAGNGEGEPSSQTALAGGWLACEKERMDCRNWKLDLEIQLNFPEKLCQGMRCIKVTAMEKIVLYYSCKKVKDFTLQSCPYGKFHMC